MIPGDRLVVSFVRPIAIRYEFKDWPLHVTIVPWFRSDLSTEQIAEDLRGRFKDIKPFTARAGEEARFGHQGHKQVNLIELPSPFTELEKRTRTYLKEHGAWLADETTKRQSDYHPHVTIQGQDRLAQGETFTCDSFFIVEQLGSRKRVQSLVLLARI